jgi:hypothetical protein
MICGGEALMASQELVDYVKSCLEKGFSREQVRQAIIQAGYESKEAEDALASATAAATAAGSTSAAVPRPQAPVASYAVGVVKPASSFQKLLVPVLVVVIIIVIGLALFFGGGVKFVSSPNSGGGSLGGGGGVESGGGGLPGLGLQLPGGKAGISNLVFLSDFTDAGFDTHHFLQSKNAYGGGIYGYSFSRNVGAYSDVPDFSYDVSVIDSSEGVYKMMANQGYAHWWGNETLYEYLKKGNPNSTIEEISGVGEECVYLEDAVKEEFRLYEAQIHFVNGEYDVDVSVEKPFDVADKNKLVALAKIIAGRIDSGGIPADPDKESGPISVVEKEELLRWCEQSNYHAYCTATIAIASDDLQLCKEEKWYLGSNDTTQFGQMLGVPETSNEKGEKTNIILVDWREKCFTAYAQYTRNKEVCKEYNADYCIVTHWSNADEIEHCSQDDVQNDLDDCYYDYASLWKDRSACERVLDSRYRDNCIRNNV